MSMNPVVRQLRSSPTLSRVGPFVVFLLLTFLQNQFGEPARYWFYLAKTLVGAWTIWLVWPFVAEMRWRVSLAAVVTGFAVFVLWIGLDDCLMRLGLAHSYPKPKASPWNPFLQFGAGTALTWFFVVVRILGSTLVVPPLEEVFFRSWLYRYLTKVDFQTVPLGKFMWLPFLVTSVAFGLEHREWLAGILCGFAFQGLVCWKKRLGDAITAHALTNLLLGLWVAWKGAWEFW